MTLQTDAAENFRSYQWGDERTVKRTQTVSKEPHRRERKLSDTVCQSEVRAPAGPLLTFFFVSNSQLSQKTGS